MSKQWCPTCHTWVTLVPVPGSNKYDDIACWACGAILDDPALTPINIKEEETETEETCPICTGTPQQSHDYDHDLRTLRLSNGYQLSEGTNKLKTEPPGSGNYIIKTCKTCRGEFIEMLWAWLNGNLLPSRQPHDAEHNIPYREAGRIVMLSREQWDIKTGLVERA